MAGKFYARFHVRHEDDSDSYLRKAYTNMDLILTVLCKRNNRLALNDQVKEKNVQGGETAMLHLDDWEYCNELFNDPVSKEKFYMVFSKK